TWNEAVDGAASFSLAGYSDWRLPTIKELYSLIDFRGGSQMTEAMSVPYLDTTVFDFIYGDSTKGERLIDAQYWSATKYVHTTMNGDDTAFVKYVRGNAQYGVNAFVDNGDGTIADNATGLVWQQGDNGQPVSWQDALAYCETLDLGGHSDWRLPNAKELQSIVDYGRSPKTTGSAAIDPLFGVTEIESYYWSSTTHKEGPTDTQGKQAVYVCFGRALGYIEQPPNSGTYQLLDVHGAGAQRSDPKEGNPTDYPHGFGPQGDDIRIYNYVRCVRATSN
ncbi:MAG: DUF1566 domain-containing protein, partial [Myxococcales bacterium]|nr:DUF1566 domain-containing protein [Myxococcales bacterium]